MIPDALPTAKPALQQYVADSRKDPGALRIELLQQSDRPNHFTIVSVWSSEKAFDAHLAAAHTRWNSAPRFRPDWAAPSTSACTISWSECRSRDRDAVRAPQGRRETQKEPGDYRVRPFFSGSSRIAAPISEPRWAGALAAEASEEGKIHRNQ